MEADPLSQSMQKVTAGNGIRAVLSILPALLAGALLRIWMLKHFFEVTGDSLIYGGIAKNLLLSGQYALTVGTGETYPTLIRLPGYPLFLAACFKVFGMENYASAACVQIVLDLLACLLMADLARRVAPERLKRGAGYCTLWMAALCPFTAVYVANPLTEGLTLFTIALAMWCAARFEERPGWGAALGFTLAVTYAALLRPDGALVAVAFAPVPILRLVRSGGEERRALMRVAAICVLLAVLPFAGWAWRNWKTFHIVEPLAPRYANDPGEPAQTGWVSWVKTWCVDFVSTYQVYWSVPGDTLDISKLPKRALDTPEQLAETAGIANDYNNGGNVLTPQIDARFANLARERFRAHPFKRHVLLPLARMLDMWLRPRVENLPIDLDWWVYSHHNAETRFSWFYAGLNALYLSLGIAGLWLRPRLWKWMLTYMVLRSLLLTTVEAPEARYTLECFPMLFVLGGVALYRFTYVVLLSVFRVNASEGRG
jgi:hypothetical protein